MSTKISVLRNFGTEQFSITIEEPALDLNASLLKLDEALQKEFTSVNDRQIREKEELMKYSARATQLARDLEESLKKETQAAVALDKAAKLKK